MSNDETLKPCPNGHAMDEDECPYPANRECTIWQVSCSSCGWAIVGWSPEEAVTLWNTRQPAQEPVKGNDNE